MAKRAAKSKASQPPQTVLELSAASARKFFLKPESYCNIDFPPYIEFGPLIRAVEVALGNRDRRSIGKPGDYEDVNYSLLTNKDGRYAWRPFQLMHPVLYVALVNAITEKGAWKLICERFAEFQAGPRSRCLSIPLRSRTKRTDRAAQILNWWQEVEQGSIERALEYAYVFHADITDCYPSIYTHSIAWALHTKPVAKQRRQDFNLIGNVIDTVIQDMRHRQTNGIPQGSVLMDFIAEMVLGYADLELREKLDADGVKAYCILRYRDDYRIFVNSPQTGEAVLKALTEVLIGLGLKLGAAKTTGGIPVVRSAVKPDKLAWMRSRQYDRDLAKHLLLIHAHGSEFPNSGSLRVALLDYHTRLVAVKRAIRNPMVLISIAVDIAYNNPKVFDVCAGVVSRLLVELDKPERDDTIKKIEKKIDRLPNVGHLEVWLQRISHGYVPDLDYSESICKLVQGQTVPLWKNDWISDKKLIKVLSPAAIVNQKALKSLAKVVRPSEINLFLYD